MLDASEAALAANPGEDHRHRVEHCGVMRPDDVTRLAGLGLIPVPQGRFVYEIGDGMAAALGPAREPWCYRLRSLPDAGCVPDERITTAQALHAYTYGSAYAAFREDDLGTIEPGKLADFAVLSADPTDFAALAGASVLATLVGGELVYQRGMDAHP